MEYSIKIDNLTKIYKLYKNDKDRFKDLFFGKRYTILCKGGEIFHKEFG